MTKSLRLAQSIHSKYISLLKIPIPVFLIVFILLISAFTGFAQQKNSYDLLWKISGKGLTKPSYLFGTMHVKDKRAFGFSDSVMVSIRKCDAFALEVHPDTLVSAVFAKLETSDTSIKVKNLLNKVDYNVLAKRFQEKNGYSIDEVNPMKVESLLKHPRDKPDDKQTFVDAYLYGIARTMNKKIYGLEKSEDQVNTLYGDNKDLKGKLENLVDLNDSLENAYKEKLITIYNTGSIEAVLNFIKNDELLNDAFIARNKVMLHSMIGEMATQSVFVAVGVAHLPGKNGLIALLRKEGYTVTAENATFTGVADGFKVDYNKMHWETYTDKERGYSMETPGLTMLTKTQDGLDVVVYPDMTNEVYYGTYAIPKSNESTAAHADEVIKNIIDNYTKNSNYVMLNKKTVLQNGQQVTDFSIQKGQLFLRLQIRVVNNILYCLYVGNKLENLNQPFAERFFESFKSIKPEAPKNKAWIAYNNTPGAFKVNLPDEPQFVTKDIPNPNQKNGPPFTINMYMAQDKFAMGVYIVRYNDYPAGNYLADKNTLFNAMAGEFATKGKILGNAKTIYLDGVEGREFKIMLSDKYYTETRMYVRGNRMYFLLKENLAENATTPINDDFFSSFKLTPYQQPAYYNYSPADGRFGIKLPSKPIVTTDTLETTSYLTNNVSAFCTNPNSGGSYGVEYSKISDYYRIKDTDSLYRKIMKRLVNYKDTILKVDTISFNGKKGLKYVVQTKSTGIKQTKGLLIDNGYVYFLSSHTNEEEQTSEAFQTFFNSLAVKYYSGFNLSSSKAEKIRADLTSTDTTIFNAAKGALSYYKFNKNELPVVYKILQSNYADDSLRNGTRSKLIENLKDVNDGETVKNLQTLFAATDGKDRLRADIMATIPAVDKKTGYDIYLKMLTTTPALKVNDYYYQVFNPLTDSVGYAAVNFNSLLPLLSNTEYRKKILHLTSMMLYDENKDLYYNLLKTNFNIITKYANNDLNKYLLEKDSTYSDWLSPIYDYLRLIIKIKNESLADSFTAKIIQANPRSGTVSEAAIARIKNHLPINQIVLNILMDSIANRYDMMQALYEEKQLTKIPLKYKKQDEFASLCLYQYTLDDDDNHPEKITPLGNVISGGMLYYAFKFTRPLDDEKTNYLGIVGPFKPGFAQLKFGVDNTYTAWEAKKVNWQLQATKLIPKLKKQLAANKPLNNGEIH
ncbi:MAG: TraB/GumN family protein [Mucilaginibacter sp.]|uniref:TraB/GumN family protein n=1 Tax=Mucilaginibacter sp. TaxID=1882438 RepID=UPI00326595F0